MELRFIEVNGGLANNKKFVYYAKNIIPVSCHSRYNFEYRGTATVKYEYTPIVFTDSVVFSSDLYTGPDNSLIFVVYVQENQPSIERVVEIGTLGISINVYNENGVLICSNGVPKSASQSTPPTVNSPGEMTSVPGEESGEMASETTYEPGAMI